METRSTTKRQLKTSGSLKEAPICTTPTNATTSADNGEKTNSRRHLAKSVSAVSMRSGSSRVSKETLRRRVIYDAELQVAKIKEDLIAKKLAMEIAEIDDIEEIDDDNKTCGTRVEEWLTDLASALPPHDEHRGPPQHAYKNGGPHHSEEPHKCCEPGVPTQKDPTLPPQIRADFAAATAPATTAPAHVVVATPEVRTVPLAVPMMKIRSYELPSFGGVPADWLLFKRSYEMSTATYNFSDFENITRLQRALTGEAKSAVEDLLRTGSDPKEIINALDQEFGHPNLLLECALQKIKALTRVSESGAELRKFTSVVRNCVSILRNIRADGYINNPQLVSDVLSKLSHTQRAQYGEYVMKLDTSQKSEDLRVSPNLDIVVEFLTYLSRASSYYMPINTTPSTTAPKTSNNVNPYYADGRRVNPSSATGFQKRQAGTQQRDRVFTNVEVSSAESEVKCVVCGEVHELPKCEKYLSMCNDDRWELVRVNRLCFKCLSQNHARYQCRAKRCDKCRLSHHSSLHRSSDAAVTAVVTEAPLLSDRASSPTTVMDTESVTNIGERFTKALLKVIPIEIYDNDRNKITSYALLDDGATVSLIDESLCINLNGPVSALRIISARGISVTDDRSRRVTTQVSGPNGEVHNITLRTIKNLDLPSQSIPASAMNHAYLRHLDIAFYKDAKPMVLLGQDNWELIVNDSIRRGRSGQPVASRTRLGWVVHGPMGPAGGSDSENVNFITETDDLHELVKRQFELESIGITEVSRKNMETERAIEILDSTSRRVEGGWEVGLLWKKEVVDLPNNYNYALKRLLGIEARMKKDEEFALAYTRQINRLVEEKYARVVDKLPDRPVWYLPHFGVTNPNKPNKLRLVFDAAATYQGTSLNDNLLTGPDMLNSLLGVLLKFRMGPIAYTADIADMFLRIRMRAADQGAQMFLWQGEIYVMDCMIFGAKCSPTSAIYILNKNASEFEHYKPEAVRAVRDNHYMDDYLDSVETVESARQLIKDVSEVHASGGFTIRGWVTNSAVLRAELPAVVPGNVNLDRSPNNSERTLGMIWVPEDDILKFDLSFKKLAKEITDGRKIPTKREYLKFIMSIFDPLGFLYPYTIRSKILLQKIWRSGIGWDEILHENEESEWRRWLQEVKCLVDVQIPRWFGLVLSDLKLHVFGDASEQAYSAVAYVVGWNAQGQQTASIVAGKARVAPLKVVSIPRLELQAAVLACRLASCIARELGSKITGKYLWTDSKTVLKWIRSDPRDYQKFVSHRLAEIDRKSNINEWRWVPSVDNPADEATKLHWPTEPKLWFTGPHFLLKPKNEWPVTEYNDDAVEDAERVHRVCIVQQCTPLIDVSRFSSWTRAVRVTARVMLFVSKCRKRQHHELTADVFRDAETFLLKQSQAISFPDELRAMTEGMTQPPSSSKLRNLDPFIYEEDGLLRVRGRLSAASHLSFDEKHPIILDGRCKTVHLLIHNFHKKALHANNNTVINCLRERYWITHLRGSVKAVTLKCQFCQIRRAMPSEPKMGDLPLIRLENTRRAFVHCGIDYFGPMEVAIGRRREKRWGVLFTCLVTRAVHFELAASLSADSAIMALRRFIARRGQPAVMCSDRGTNFVGADAELKAALRSLDHDTIQNDAVTRGISWRYNPPASPHMGGCWERLVRSVKAALKATLNQRAPREEVLLTLLAEAEMLINSRPLTYVDTDPNEPVALTPNHLLIGTASGLSTLGTFDPVDLDSRKSWRKAQALAEMFWHRWLKEYVPTLQKRQKWLNSSQPIKEGDVVLIFDKNQPRNTWPRGIVSGVYPGSDGQVRVVDVTLADGTVLKRPTVRIVVLPTDRNVEGE